MNEVILAEEYQEFIDFDKKPFRSFKFGIWGWGVIYRCKWCDNWCDNWQIHKFQLFDEIMQHVDYCRQFEH